MTNPISDLLDGRPRAILVVGSNTPHAHPIIWRQWMKPAVERGARLIVVDPRAPDLARLAAVHVPVQPGTEVDLFNAMAHHIVVEGLHDEAFLRRRCTGWDAFWEVVKVASPERAAEACGLSASLIRQAAAAYAAERPASIVYGLGVTEHRNGVDAVRALANLSLLTGNVGRPGGGVNALRGQNNVQGATDMCRPESLPGYQPWTDPAAVAKFEKAWGVLLPKPAPGDFLYCSRYWERILEGELRALYVVGSDPALTEANTSKVRRALASLDFLVVQEVFPTPTTDLAHVVLPACSFAEKDGTFVNTERRVQRVRRAIEPLGESRPDGWILAAVAARLGRPLGPAEPGDVFEEIRRLVPIYAGLSYARLDETAGIPWPCPEPHHPGTPRLHEAPDPLRPLRLAAVRPMGPAEPPDEEYPFLLTTGRTFLQYNSGSMSRRTRMEAGEPEVRVEAAPEDAARAGLRDGGWARVATRRGSVRARVRVRPMRPGVLWMPFHYREAPANLLTIDAVDPECGITELKACAARIRPEP